MLLAALVEASQAVAGTRSRRAKSELLADLLRRAGADQAELVVGLLVGDPRQGKVGVGWSTLGRAAGPAAAEPSLDIADVDTALDQVQSTIGPGSQGQRTALLQGLWGRATAPEQDFLRRLLLGELRQGALEGVMVDAIALATDVDLASVRRAAMLTGDVATVARLALSGDRDGLGRLRLQVGRGLLPMLASTAADVSDALSRTGLASVEWKLDGVRVQVHKRGGSVRVLTRNLNDVTARSPGVAAAVRDLEADQIVLDGEALGVDDAGRPDAFQDSMSRLSGDGATGATGSVTPFFFDVLHVDGEDLLDHPLAQRQDRLDSLVPAALVVPRLVASDPVDAEGFLDEALQAGHEGVVIKSLGSTYEAGRRGAQWLKVKPVHTFDLVVLAAEWGHGRRQGWLSNLHLGARDPGSGSAVMLGKTFKGLTDEMLAWQTQRLLELEQSRRAGTVQVRPELVVEVAIDGVQRSTRYPGGVALRFARVKRYRPDKEASQADTVEAVRALLPSRREGVPSPSTPRRT